MRHGIRALTIVAAALAPAACGGSGQGSRSATAAGSRTGVAAATHSSSSAAPAATGAVQASSSAAAPAGAGATPAVAKPGSSLAVGQTATVAYRSLPSSGGATTSSTLKITVESIKQGTLSDFNGIQLDATQKASTPDYVKVRFTNLGAHSVHATDASVDIEGVDDTGQTEQSVTFIGTFAPCPDNEPNAALSTGQSFETCLTFLVPGGIKKVAYTGTDSYVNSPVTWSAQ